SPNGDSLIWFLSEVWPKIHSRLGDRAALTIAGICKSEHIRSLAGPMIRITGHLEDLSDLYDGVRVFIAPTRFAAGIPHKVHEASARGVPVVATSVLAQQLGWSDDAEISIADDAAAFAEKCIALHEDEHRWRRFRETALEAIRRECAPEVFESRLRDI